MKKLLASVLFVMLCLFNHAQTSDWLWVTTVMGKGDEVVMDNALDANGNLIVMGRYTGLSIAFGNIILTNTVNGGNFLVKYDASGNVIWAKPGNTGVNTGIHVDSDGNIYVTGYFQSQTTTFDTITLTNTGFTDAFIAKYDSLGNVLWAKSAIGTDYDFAYSIVTDMNGNIYLTGDFRSQTLTFGSAIINLLGVSAIYVVKFNSNGDVLWAEAAGGNYHDYCRGISIDLAGDIYISGYYTSSSINFGTIVLTNLGHFDIFIAKYDCNGNVLWAKSAGGTWDDYNASITTDLYGNTYITGHFRSPSITFETTTLINTDSISKGNDIYIVKYDSNGNLIWAKSAGGTDSDIGTDICVDANQNVYVTGYFDSPIVSFGTSVITNGSNTSNLFVAKFDHNGQALWGRSAGGSQGDYIICIAVDQNGNMYVAGYFVSPSITFGSTTLNNGGPFCSYDMFIAKLSNQTGVADDIKINPKVNISPNPFSYLTTIHSDVFLEDATLIIYNMNGKKVKQIKGISGKTINVSRDNLQDGIYLIRLIENNNVFLSEKIVITK